MKSMKIHMLAATVILVAAISIPVSAQDYSHSTPGISGYDPVAYFTEGEAVRGSGMYVSVFEGVTYAFESKKNKEVFDADPEKYTPEYGGYCAFGVAGGYKIVSDPEVWKIVDGKLYLNVNRNVQRRWEKDIPGNIESADANWIEIKDKPPSDL
jgi:YHS domain-containing protein